MIKNFKMNKVVIHTVVMLLSFASYVKAQPGSLDLSFNGNGKFISGNTGNAESVGLQSNGKIILGGSVFTSSWAFGVKRCNTNGTIDNTFGTSGSTVIDISPNLDFGRAIAIQADDKIILAGQSNNGTNDDIVVVRLNSDGTIDNTFGSNGIVTTTVSAYSELANDIVVQSDGKIVVGGGAYNGTSEDFILVRYNANGTLDNTFGLNGIVLTDIGTATGDEIKEIVLQSDGKIVVGGVYDSNGRDYCLVRYNANGTIDNSFGTSGKVLTDISISDELESIAIQADGKIVTVGNSYISGSTDFVLMRYNTNGSLDAGFGNLGIVTSSITTTGDYAEDIVVQSNGKIVVMGNIALSSDQDALLVRYNNNGTIDNSFGSSGTVISPIGSTYDFVLGGILDNTGRIILGGNFDNSMGAARFIGECNLDTSITKNGIILSSNQIGSHQWLDCSNSMALILSEISQVFTPTVNGSYAVQISNNGCVDTSACISITNVGIIEIERESHFKISPNPNNGEFTITTVKGVYNIVNAVGAVIKTIEVENDSEVIELKDLSQGIYYIIGKTAKAKIIITK